GQPAQQPEEQPAQQAEDQPTFGNAEIRDDAVSGAQPPPVVHEGPRSLPKKSEIAAGKPKSRKVAGAAKVKQATKRAPTPAVSQEPSTQEPAQSTVTASPGAAIYGVTIDGTGAVASIILLQSSGRTDYDAAGEQMVRTTMQFPSPQSAGEAIRYFTVTLRFTP